MRRQDGQEGTTRKRQPEKENQHRKGKLVRITGYPGQDCLENRTAKTGLSGKNSRAGHSGQDCQEKTTKSEHQGQSSRSAVFIWRSSSCGAVFI
jgi:hypothetical protein